MGGQQAGEKASLMAVELIPRAIARRLAAQEKEPRRSRSRFARRRRVNSEILGSSGWSPNTRTWNDRRPGPVPPGPRLRRGDRRFPGVPPARQQLEQLTRTIRCRCLAGRRHDHQGRAVNTQVQERALSLPGQQGCAQWAEEFKVLDVRPGDRFLLASDGSPGCSDEELARC